MPTIEEINAVAVPFGKLLYGDKLKSTGMGENWTAEQKGRALATIHILANTSPDEWRTKTELHAALAEFRTE